MSDWDECLFLMFNIKLHQYRPHLKGTDIDCCRDLSRRWPKWPKFYIKTGASCSVILGNSPPSFGTAQHPTNKYVIDNLVAVFHDLGYKGTRSFSPGKTYLAFHCPFYFSMVPSSINMSAPHSKAFGDYFPPRLFENRRGHQHGLRYMTSFNQLKKK
ncbi:hypothetical protein DPMN_028125 [Dreissena polymorpha]|uniref:Uncharacterized protein n=1 Tax=Dreissena polymorpha TaxID=45954 RepID=A0A9D4LW33_DREPO|nr:hypothetical protein DPMN_028125 [Dreissena polymorpha]